MTHAPGNTPTELSFGDPPRIEWRDDEDGEHWEHRTEVASVLECPRCHGDVQCEAETDNWTMDDKDPRRWNHDAYGPATGFCCGLTLVDWWGGTFVFDTEESHD
jgi:hypothetical protein